MKRKNSVVAIRFLVALSVLDTHFESALSNLQRCMTTAPEANTLVHSRPTSRESVHTLLYYHEVELQKPHIFQPNKPLGQPAVRMHVHLDIVIARPTLDSQQTKADQIPAKPQISQCSVYRRNGSPDGASMPKTRPVSARSPLLSDSVQMGNPSPCQHHKSREPRDRPNDSSPYPIPRQLCHDA